MYEVRFLTIFSFSFYSQSELFRVLKAYSILNPIDGYFQGQAPVAAMLVMHMPAEEAFGAWWLSVRDIFLATTAKAWCAFVYFKAMVF